MSNDYATGWTLTDTRLEGMDQTPLIYYPEPFAIVHSELSQHHGSLELHKEGGFVIKQALSSLSFQTTTTEQPEIRIETHNRTRRLDLVQSDFHVYPAKMNKTLHLWVGHSHKNIRKIFHVISKIFWKKKNYGFEIFEKKKSSNLKLKFQFFRWIFNEFDWSINQICWFLVFSLNLLFIAQTIYCWRIQAINSWDTHVI